MNGSRVGFILVSIALVIVTGVLIGVSQDVSRLDQELGAMKIGISALQVETEGICHSLRQFSDIDWNFIPAGAARDNPERIEPLFDQMLASTAYCRDSVAVRIDAEGFPNRKILFQGTEITRYMRGYWRYGLDSLVSVVDEAGLTLGHFDFGVYSNRGDFVRIWLSPKTPEELEFAFYYDPVSGLAASIQHVHGAFLPPVIPPASK